MSIEAFTKLIPEYEGYPDEAIIRIECSVRELRQTANKISAQPERVSVPREQLEHWAEYWNGSANERAMSDALEHILGEVADLLAAAQEGK